MGKGRAMASIIALALAMSLFGACGSANSKSGNASVATQSAAQTNAARAAVAAARGRLAAAQLLVTRQRRAIAAALHRRQLDAATSTTTTTTTTAAQVAPSTQPAIVSETPTTFTTAASDTAAIQHTIDAINAAFAKSVVDGIAASDTANYYIGAGVYTDAECSAFETARGLGVVSDRLVLDSGSVVPAPGWVDPVLGAVPQGRVYALTMDDVETQLSTQQQRTQTVATHVTVQADGRALLFLACK
jgi:hypothetical protein